MWAWRSSKCAKIATARSRIGENITKHWLNTTTLHATFSLLGMSSTARRSDLTAVFARLHARPEGSGVLHYRSVSIETIVQHARVLLDSNETRSLGRTDSGGRASDESTTRNHLLSGARLAATTTKSFMTARGRLSKHRRRANYG